jgi:hypothetical protein
MSIRDSEQFRLEVDFARYAQLVDRENCLLVNETVRDTMSILALLSLTSYKPVQVDDIAILTGLAEGFVTECLATLAFEGFVRETDLGFQCCLQVEKLTWRDHRSLNQALLDMGQESVLVRARSGSWSQSYFWPEPATEAF